jgi:hypothetical protein
MSAAGGGPTRGPERPLRPLNFVGQHLTKKDQPDGQKWRQDDERHPDHDHLQNVQRFGISSRLIRFG